MAKAWLPGPVSRSAAANPRRLQVGELAGQRASCRRRPEEALAPVLLAFPLLDEALVDELLENPPEGLLGDAQDVEQLRHGETGIAIDEMQDAMMRTPEAVAVEKLVGVGDEVPIGEEEELDEVVERLGRRAPSLALCSSCKRRNLRQPY